MAEAEVIALSAHVPQETRELAKAAYLAKQAYQNAMHAHVAAMQAFSKSLKKHGLKPEQLQVGNLCGSSLVPAIDWFDEKGRPLK